MLPRKKLTKMARSGAMWGVPEYAITKLKIQQRTKSQPKNLIAIFLSQLNLDEHVSTKINTSMITKGGLGSRRIFLKNPTKWRLFHIFLLFGKAP